ncbi:MAG: hypothetical protein IH624_02585 [Phycisphaerae bacterium]|nr:hypothetical protein [Phycisphaerae bacterium]
MVQTAQRVREWARGTDWTRPYVIGHRLYLTRTFEKAVRRAAVEMEAGGRCGLARRAETVFAALQAAAGEMDVLCRRGLHEESDFVTFECVKARLIETAGDLAAVLARAGGEVVEAGDNCEVVKLDWRKVRIFRSSVGVEERSSGVGGGSSRAVKESSSRVGPDGREESSQVVKKSSSQVAGGSSVGAEERSSGVGEESSQAVKESSRRAGPDGRAEETITLSEAAGILGVGKGTVCKWANSGRLADNGAKGRARRVALASVLRRKHEMEEKDVLADARELRADSRRVV